MKRFFFTLLLAIFLLTGLVAQSTWRGQAEIWTDTSVPADGFFAASNEFPKNTVLFVENYKSKKTIQIRIVAPLPAGATALLLLSPKAATALEVNPGESTLVGAQIDNSIDSFKGVARDDRPDNPDPDVNPLAQGNRVAVAPLPRVVPSPTPTPSAKTPRSPVETSPLALADASTKVDPSLLPSPVAQATPEPTPTAIEPVTEATPPLAMTSDAEQPTVQPGRHVFLPSKEPANVIAEAVSPTSPESPTVSTEPVTETPHPVVETTPTVVQSPAISSPLAETEPVETPMTVPSTPTAEIAKTEVPVKSPEVVRAPTETSKIATLPSAVSIPQTTEPVKIPTKVPIETLPTKTPAVQNTGAYVTPPASLKGPLLGTVAVVKQLEKGKPYVQIGVFADEKSLVGVLDKVKSYVPVAIWFSPEEKNPYRLIVASATNSQLGVLLMHYRSQGFRSATVIKG